MLMCFQLLCDIILIDRAKIQMTFSIQDIQLYAIGILTCQ